VAPKVTIAGSGMMTGGRVMRHAVRVLPKPENQIVFVGYQANGTLGRKIVDGWPSVNIQGEPVEVRAKVKEIHAMSAHADQKQLLSWLLTDKKLKKVILIHGEEEQRMALSAKIKVAKKDVEISMPFGNQEINLSL
jgi:metallo-beta-lactamase family protein